MIEKYIYSHNEELKYLSEEEVKYRGKLINPLFIEKLTWYLLLLIYCIWIRKNLELPYVIFGLGSFLNGPMANSLGYYLLILLYAIIGLTGISLIVKTVQLYALSANSNEEGEMVIKKKIFKKWCTYILNTIFSISLINYITSNLQIWFNVLIITLITKIIIKLMGLLISRFRIAMISEALEDTIEEVENRDLKKVEDSIAELIGDGEGIEFIWGLGFKHILMETKNLFEKIEEITKEEKELYQNKNYLITNLSHDLKTPLTSIINSIYILKHEKLSEEEKEEQIEILEKKLERLNILIKDLNETVNTDYEGLVVNKKEIKIIELIKGEINLYENKFKSSNLDIKLNAPKEDITLFMDEEKTIRIVDNILSNINKYSLEDTRVYVDIIKNEENVEITFKNISKYDIDVDVNTIGERFVQGDKSRNIEGHGLGLSIIKSLVNIQGGKVRLDIQGDLFKLVLKFTQI